MHIRFLPLVLLVQFFVFLFPLDSFGKKENLVFFPNTPYELNIYKIYGKKEGKTLMLIGGIQGNEPGGFLSADLYADMTLLKGNLIVVPRANFYSILLNQRGPHGDMNRKFSQRSKNMSMDDKIVSILKGLIAESDYLLNLHDGAGYYYPQYISKWRNQKRFGQSIITDCEQYRVTGEDRVIDLGGMARKVIEEINKEIINELHKFHFNNTQTEDPASMHREQLKSATYYALTQHHIPAFGIETSKFLPSIDLKVRYHNLAINAFMKLFDIVPENPSLVLDSPVLKYLVVSINGQTPIVVKERQALRIASGDNINMVHIEANYERGLTADILGYGNLNDFRNNFSIYKDTSIVIKKDHRVFAEIPVKVSSSEMREHGGREDLVHGEVDYFILEVNGKRHLVGNDETIEVVRGDCIKLIDVLPENLAVRPNFYVNFKGFVGNWKNNTGEDRGYMVDTATDLLGRYSLHGNKRLYRIIAVLGEKAFGEMLVDIAEPSLEYLILRLNENTYALKDKAVLSAGQDDSLTVEAIKSNVACNAEINITIEGEKIIPGETKKVGSIAKNFPGNTLKINFIRGKLPMGEVYIRLG